ncbi:hypothetical protein [Ornithinibacillus caprae]|uniref:hypothetical protein n=1 Tax=Ornithinibacillus caprae TaxID=2678566 RepID=UPI001FE9F285|nr:hypothetical protein [Ornithinibacillus caprae]
MILSEIGQIEETQYIKLIAGDKVLCVTIDGNYLMEALTVILEDKVSLSFNGSMKPILIVPVGK